MLDKSKVKGLVHVGPRIDLGQGKYDNLPPSAVLWVISMFNGDLKKPRTVYLIDLDNKNNPVYTDEINECAKFDSWSNVKKFWRSTSGAPPKTMPSGSVKLEPQPFGKEKIPAL